MSDSNVKTATWRAQSKGMGCAILTISVACGESAWRAVLTAARAAAASLLVVFVSACYSPTLPVPPPDSPEAVVSADGLTVTVDGGALPGALVFVFNTDLGQGVVTTGTQYGRFHAVVPVDFYRFPRNTLEIWQRMGIDDSSSIPVYCDRMGCQ
jgi:hypothetical protein